MILLPGLPPSQPSPVSPVSFLSGQQLQRLMLPHTPSQKPFPAAPRSLPPPDLEWLAFPHPSPALRKQSSSSAVLGAGCHGDVRCTWLL